MFETGKGRCALRSRSLWILAVAENVGNGAAVHILSINKQTVIMCGKTIKADKLDAKFLGELHPSDEIPEVYISILTEEGRRNAERDLDRIKASINRINANTGTDRSNSVAGAGLSPNKF